MTEQEYTDALEVKNQRIAELEKENAELQTKYDDALTANEALVAEIEKEPQSITASTPLNNLADLSFEHDGKTISFNFYKMNHKGSWITAEEVSLSEALQKELIRIESGMLKL